MPPSDEVTLTGNCKLNTVTVQREKTEVPDSCSEDLAVSRHLFETRQTEKKKNEDKNLVRSTVFCPFHSSFLVK